MLNLGQKLRETQSVSAPGVNQRRWLIKTRYTYICFTWNIEDCYCYKYCKQIIYIANHYKWHDVRVKSVTAHSVYSNSKASLWYLPWKFYTIYHIQMEVLYCIYQIKVINTYVIQSKFLSADIIYRLYERTYSRGTKKHCNILGQKLLWKMFFLLLMKNHFLFYIRRSHMTEVTCSSVALSDKAKYRQIHL